LEWIFRSCFQVFSENFFRITIKAHSIGRIRRDFAFIWLLIGNDYLPKIRGSKTIIKLFQEFSGFKEKGLWHRYVFIRRRMPEEYIIHENGEINWKFFLAYLAPFGANSVQYGPQCIK
jgi:hypothetical protein